MSREQTKSIGGMAFDEYAASNFQAHMNKVIKSNLNKSDLEGGFPREAIEYPSSSSEEEQEQFERIESKVLSNKTELANLMSHR